MENKRFEITETAGSVKGFASAVCKFSGAINAYEHIRVSGDRLAIHEKFDESPGSGK